MTEAPAAEVPTPVTATETSTASTSTTITSNALAARELEWAKNPMDVLEEHKKRNGSIIRTRFPPEPNGYLHVGHAKSMNMNFSLAFDKLNVPMENRRTIFRYDDTNPEAESKEYIDSLLKDLQWLGWKPERTTYSSENFQQLYDFAVQLIQKGLAYVCDMTKTEMEQQRELAMKRANVKNLGKDPDVEYPIPSPDILPGRNRNTSIERNLQLFNKMKLGFFNEGQYTLRLKMDFESSNPNMYDLVAYRIKYIPHPHTGSGWCIYPNYDFTHGICDSLEDIDYSICTLEFETRREPYYWILWALNLFRPNVYEMSRLNLQYTVLSKRRLLKLVTANYVRGWDDPRMPTISGLRRRGYTKDIINSFCNDVGATRAMNVVEMNKLYQTARTILSKTSQRIMATLDPIKVTLSNWESIYNTTTDTNNNDIEKELTYDVQNSPTDPNLGTHTVTFTPSTFYIDSTDFREVDSDDYYGLAPNKAVGLKYHGGNIICDKIIKDPSNKIIELICRLDVSSDKPKPKTHISWVPSNSIPCEVRVYDHLFTVPEPSDLWEDELNPTSEIVYKNALIDPSITTLIFNNNDNDNNNNNKINKWTSNIAVQFERMGYYVIDYETNINYDTKKINKLIFNRTVSLKEESTKSKTKLTKVEELKLNERKLKQQNDLKEKEIRMKIKPNELFQLGNEYIGKYSKYNETTGIPTHFIDGTELTKSAMKKLQKEQQKHIKALAKWNK